MNKSKLSYAFLTVLFLLTAAFSVQTEKDRYIAYLQETITFVKGEEFYQLLIAGDSSEVQAVSDEIASNHDFANAAEALLAGKQYGSEELVQKLTSELETEINKQSERLHAEIDSHIEAIGKIFPVTSGKEKLVTFTKKAVDFMKTPEFAEMMKKGDQAASEKRVQEIAQECGFKDLIEVQAAADKYADDPEIKKLGEDAQREIEAIMNKIMQEMTKEQVPPSDSLNTEDLPN